MRKPGVNAEESIKSTLAKLKHADQATLVSYTGLSESTVSRALHRLYDKQEAYREPNPESRHPHWRLTLEGQIAPMIAKHAGQWEISKWQLQVRFQGWIRATVDARARLLYERFLGAYPPPSVTFATSRRRLIENLAHAFQEHLKTIGIDQDLNSIRSMIRTLLKQWVIKTEPMLMLNYSPKKFNDAVKKFTAKAREEGEKDLSWLS